MMESQLNMISGSKTIKKKKRSKEHRAKIAKYQLNLSTQNKDFGFNKMIFGKKPSH